MQAIGLVARFQAAPKETHVQAVKRIFRYLKGTLDYGLWYPRGEDFTLTTYTDANWARSVDDRTSTSGILSWQKSSVRAKQKTTFSFLIYG